MRQLLCSILFLITLINITSAHEFYDSSCCSDKDCRPVPCKELIAQDDGGVKYKEFKFYKSQSKPAPDGMCHVCIWNSTPMCYYLPPGT